MDYNIFFTYFKKSNFERFLFFEMENKIYYISLTTKPNYSDSIIEKIIVDMIQRYPIEFDDILIDIIFDDKDIQKKMELKTYIIKFKINKLLNA